MRKGIVEEHGMELGKYIYRKQSNSVWYREKDTRKYN